MTVPSENLKMAYELLCGRRKTPNPVLEETYCLLSQNKIGTVDYNKYGTSDQKGFIAVSEAFIDNFLLSVYVPSYRLDKKGNYTEIGSMNSTIVGYLKHGGLLKSTVKAVEFAPVGARDIPIGTVIPFEDETSETENLRIFFLAGLQDCKLQ